MLPSLLEEQKSFTVFLASDDESDKTFYVTVISFLLVILLQTDCTVFAMSIDKGCFVETKKKGSIIQVLNMGSKRKEEKILSCATALKSQPQNGTLIPVGDCNKSIGLRAYSWSSGLRPSRWISQ